MGVSAFSRTIDGGLTWEPARILGWYADAIAANAAAYEGMGRQDVAEVLKKGYAERPVVSLSGGTPVHYRCAEGAGWLVGVDVATLLLEAVEGGAPGV